MNTGHWSPLVTIHCTVSSDQCPAPGLSPCSILTPGASDDLGFLVPNGARQICRIVNIFKNWPTPGATEVFISILCLIDSSRSSDVHVSRDHVSMYPRVAGDRHVSEIASMALDLLAGSVVFQIPHRPNARLNIRMGIHRWGKYFCYGKNI